MDLTDLSDKLPVWILIPLAVLVIAWPRVKEAMQFVFLSAEQRADRKDKEATARSEEFSRLRGKVEMQTLQIGELMGEVKALTITSNSIVESNLACERREAALAARVNVLEQSLKIQDTLPADMQKILTAMGESKTAKDDSK